MGAGAWCLISLSSLVGVEFPLSDSESVSVSLLSLSDSASGEAALSRSTSGSTEGSGGLVGAGVASPDAVARLSEERDRGMSVARSGSGGAENKSENPPPDFGTSGASSDGAGGGGGSSGSSRIGLGAFSGGG